MREEEMREGFETGYINSSYNSNLAYRPQFISNDYKSGRKVIYSIKNELSRCDEFLFSVAFITEGGIEPLLLIFEELDKKNIPGKILTTDYRLFTQPKALKKLEKLKNIELRMNITKDSKEGFHTKGYIFREDNIYKIIIGSSNMTLSALTVNREWNTKIVSTPNGQITEDILAEFWKLWNAKNTFPYSEISEEYEIEYAREQLIKKQKKAASENETVNLDQYKLKPNKMQAAFVRNIVDMKEKGINKALFCSATGTGKTIASAFAVREFKAKRVLFIVHREQIARQAMESYKRVFGSSVTYGLISGSSHEIEADFIFATMQMMSKESIYTLFEKDTFDFIIIDEAHHAGAESYKKIMNYFKPKFYLGMTASPDTANYDIYEIFDHNIAYELRLNQALEEDLVCTFHYFGITDLEIDGEIFDDQTGVKNFSRLVSDVRVDYIIEKIKYYGYSGDRVKGVVFCSRTEEAKELSKKFNLRGYRTEVLTGEDSVSKREETIERLTMDENNGEQISRQSESPLDYIFTVDIFNEGVDIPEINQVIMLRPTQSPVVFVQQLGRGLRKFNGKEYVVILDFIGNYMNNFMIPIALSGDRSYNKDNMRRYIMEGDKIIPGSSTVQFDEISRKRIYSSIDAARTNETKFLKESYLDLKWKLGRIPKVVDFKKYGSIDVTKFFEKFGSYYNFLKRYDEEYTIRFSSEEEEVIEYLSKKVLSYKRIHEIDLLSHLIRSQERVSLYLNELIKEDYNLVVSRELEESVYRNLTNAFPKERDKQKYCDCVLIEKDSNGGYILSKSFEGMLKNCEFKTMVLDLLDYGIENYQDNYSNLYKNTNFSLYQKYTYEDVCRLLNWKKDANAQNIGGYFYDAETKTLPVFINYQKEETAIAYEDRFVSENSLIALSKHPRKVTSGDADHIYKRTKEDKENRIYLFVRKNKDDNEAKEFYFLGEINACGEPKAIHMESTNDDAFEIFYHLEEPVRSDIYDYILAE